MEKFLDELLNNNFLVAMQFNFLKEDNMKSHIYGFKLHRLKGENYVVVFPKNIINNGKKIINYITSLYDAHPFESISIGVINKDIICNLFNISIDKYNRILNARPKEYLVKKQWNYFKYFKPNSSIEYFRIPKELVKGTIFYNNKNKSYSFMANKNYIENLDEKSKLNFLELYNLLLLSKGINNDYDVEYPYRNIKEVAVSTINNSKLNENNILEMKRILKSN